MRGRPVQRAPDVPGAKQLCKALIEGLPLQQNTLTNFLNKERFALRPLHNFFFTRDSAVTVYDDVLLGSMASPVRLRESLIMEAIFNNHPSFKTTTISAVDKK